MRWRKTAIERGEPSWQTSSTSPMSMPSSSDAVATTARSCPDCSLLLDAEPGALGERAVVRGDDALAEQRLEIVRHALAHAPRRHEDQRRLVRADERAQPRVHVLPRLARGDRADSGSFGTSTATSSGCLRPASTMRHARGALRRPRPARSRRESARPRRPPAPSPRGRCAPAAAPSARAAAPATAPGARRACCRRARGSRRRSRSRRRRARRAPSPTSAADRATRAW